MSFFRRDTGALSLADAPVEPTVTDVVAEGPSQATMVLDALGGIVQALAYYPVEMPTRSSGEVTNELTAWQRHATLGVPVSGAALATGTVGIEQRDWGGLVQAITAIRQDEHHGTAKIIGELRDALWTCVGTVHESVTSEGRADGVTDSSLGRVKRAVSGAAGRAIREDVLGAVGEIERALRDRREEQQQQYAALNRSLDALGKQLEAALKESETDPLTGVGNRKRFDVVAARAVQRVSLSRVPITLVIADMNRLKYINDSYGHLAGDAAIVSIATALRSVFKREGDSICRYGGDEFAIILNNTPLAVAKTLAQEVVVAVRASTRPHPAMEFGLGASVGVAELQYGEDVQSWVARADTAMYTAKRDVVHGICLSGVTHDPARSRVRAMA